MTRSPSLSRRIPLFLAGLVALVLGAAGVVEWIYLRRLLVRENEARLVGATTLISELLATQLAEGTSELRSRGDSLIREALADPGLEGGYERVLLAALSGRPQARGVWILDGDGACLASSGPSDVGVGAEAAMEVVASCPAAILGGAPPDGPLVGEIFAAGTEARYRVTLPLEAGSDRVVIVFEDALGSAEAGRLISSLVAPDASLLLGSEAGVWSDLGRVVAEDLPLQPEAGAARFVRDGDERIGVARTVAGTPWVAAIHRDADVVLAPSRTFAWWSLGFGTVILLVSAAAGWAGSVRVTRPLTSLARGAAAIAGGEYGRRVVVDRDDEIGRLAASFNSMAEQVERDQQVLEARVEDRTRGLREALDQLHEAQEELVRKERLATIGQLAGGVGHELRNPLGVMTNAVYYLQATQENPPPAVVRYLGILREQISVAEKIVSDLLDYARVRAPERAPVELEGLVREVLARTRVPEEVRVDVAIDPGTPPALADRVQVAQIVQNLVGNAIHAMEEAGGTLALAATSENGEVTLEVRDTGVGIEPDELPRVFEPLVTSKAKGIGLGLPVSRSFAEANGGRLTASSQPGRGSTFRLVLPAAAADVEAHA